jgi:hypothetical protein
MTTPFVAQVRSRPGAITLGAPGAETITVRVQLAEAWDVVRVVTPPSESVLSVKVRALEALDSGAESPAEFVVKLAGFEVLDEQASLADAGVIDGSILLVARRRRVPVR